MTDSLPCPAAVVVLCGKRKSGKDYVAAQLVDMLGEELVYPVRLSAPLKAQYAKTHGLDLERLMDSSSYKEAHREAMIEWSEDIRAQDPAYFCQLAVQDADPEKVWLIVDARRKSDVHFFKSRYDSRNRDARESLAEGKCSSSSADVVLLNEEETSDDVIPNDVAINKSAGRSVEVLTVRVVASPAVRQARGWVFAPGVDDATSECGLDQYPCDLTITNDSDNATLLRQKLEEVIQWINEMHKQ